MRIPTHKGHLETLTVDHARPLFDLIHVSRAHLHQWLPWLKRIHSPEDTEAFISKLTSERGPQFVIRVDGRLCGGVGFYFFDKPSGVASLGYWLGSEFAGHGIMSDAVLSLCHHGFNNVNLKKIEIRCAVQNVQSRKIPERLGFYLEGTQHKAEWVLDRYVDHAIYSILQTEFALLYAQAPAADRQWPTPAAAVMRHAKI